MKMISSFAQLVRGCQHVNVERSLILKDAAFTPLQCVFVNKT